MQQNDGKLSRKIQNYIENAIKYKLDCNED